MRTDFYATTREIGDRECSFLWPLVDDKSRHGVITCTVTTRRCAIHTSCWKETFASDFKHWHTAADTRPFLVDSLQHKPSDISPSSHPLRGLLIAQFFGAFNDNAWKLMVALLAIRQATAQMAPGPAMETAAQTQTALTFIIFTLPMMLLSLVGGTLADRLSKRTVIIAIKIVEVFLMSAGTVALWLNPTGGILPLIVLCGMGVHSALFGPSKYGILPELIPHERLAAGNGLLEMWTFAAILTGTAAGGFLLQSAGDQTWLAPLTLAALSVAGLVAAFAVPQRLARTHGRRRGLDDPRRLGRHSDRTPAAPCHPRRNLFLDDREPLRPEHSRLRQSRSASLGCDVGAPAHAVVHRHRRAAPCWSGDCLKTGLSTD